MKIFNFSISIRDIIILSAIFAYSIKCFWYDLQPLRKIYKSLKKYDDKLASFKKNLEDKIEPSAEDKEEFLEFSNNVGKCIEENVSDYIKALKLNSFKKVHPEVYFNEVNILERNINLQKISNKTSLLVGLGILGTFLGLTIGLQNLNGGDFIAKVENIDSLLSGISTAFLTSLVGMGTSLIYSRSEKNLFGDITKLINSINSRLGTIFPTGTSMETMIENIETNLILLTKEVGKNLGSEVADSIKVSTQSIFGHFGSNFEKSVNNLSSDICTSLNSVLKTVFNDGFIDEFRKIQEEIALTAKTLKTNNTSLNKIQNTFPNLVNTIEELTTNSVQIYENADKAAQKYESFLTLVERFSENISGIEIMQNEIKEMMANFVATGQKTREDYQIMSKDVEQLLENIFNNTTKALALSSKLIEDNNERIKEIGNALEVQSSKLENHLNSQLDNIQSSLDKEINVFNNYRNELLESVNYSKHEVENQKKVINNFQNEIIEKTSESLHEYDKTFSKVNKELLSIVETVNVLKNNDSEE